MKARSYAAFPGRAKVLEALAAVGSWTPRDVSKWARSNGGSEATYAALDWYVRRGRIAYTKNQWTHVARFSVAATQHRGGEA